MGNEQSLPICDFERLQEKLKNKDSFILINTLNINEQHCLIETTIHANNEEDKINSFIKSKKKTNIIIYGKNYKDISLQKKYNQLKKFGLFNIELYLGGLFEWLLLQEIYGCELFPTCGNEKDLLKYK